MRLQNIKDIAITQVYCFLLLFLSRRFLVFCQDMFLAGTATTLSFLEWTMTELMRNPKAMKKLQEEIRSNSQYDLYVTEKQAEKMNYLQAVIKEALRLRPPAPLLVPRVYSEDVKLKGYNIAAGTQVKSLLTYYIYCGICIISFICPII